MLIDNSVLEGRPEGFPSLVGGTLGGHLFPNEPGERKHVVHLQLGPCNLLSFEGLAGSDRRKFGHVSGCSGVNFGFVRHAGDGVDGNEDAIHLRWFGAENDDRLKAF